MNWNYIEFEFPVPVVINKVMAWGSDEKVSDASPRLYFACKLSSNDVAWSYYAGDSGHDLATYRTLYPRLDEADARNNYWEAGRDESGCFLAMMPAHVQIRYVRMYVGFETGEEFDVYEFRPSVFVSANEIVSGTLLITDQLATSPVISVRKGGITRLTLGNFTSSNYGLVGYNDTGDLIFELSDRQQIIAGWQFTNTLLRSSASGARIELNPGKSRISIFDSVNEKVAMGYLDGLPKNDGTGNWGSGDYGFWARNGDTLRIDGSGEYLNGDWVIKHDASYLVTDADGNIIVKLGTYNGQKGLFVFDTEGNMLSKHAADELYLGDPNGIGGYLRYTAEDGLILAGKMTFLENGPISTANISESVESGLNCVVIDNTAIKGFNGLGQNTFSLNIDGSGMLGFAPGAISWDAEGVVSVPGSIIASGINAANITTGFLSANRINTGTITATHIASSAITGDNINASSTIWINANGSLTIGNVGGATPTDYVILSQGDIIFKRYNALLGNEDETLNYEFYKSLRRIDAGTASNGDVVFLPGVYRQKPQVILSIQEMPIYDSDASDQDQKVVFSVEDLQEYDPDDNPGKYSFTAKAMLSFSEDVATYNPNPKPTGVGAATSTFSTPTTNLPANVNGLSVHVRAYSYYNDEYEDPAGYGHGYYRGSYITATLHYTAGGVEKSKTVNMVCVDQDHTTIYVSDANYITSFYLTYTFTAFYTLQFYEFFRAVRATTSVAWIECDQYMVELAEDAVLAPGKITWFAIE